jgi:hypothetical protein
MAWLALVDRVPGPEHFTRRSAYVQSVFLISPERSNGIGTSLMEFVLVHARELLLDYVEMHPSERSFRFTDASGSRTLTVSWSCGLAFLTAG